MVCVILVQASLDQGRRLWVDVQESKGFQLVVGLSNQLLVLPDVAHAQQRERTHRDPAADLTSREIGGGGVKQFNRTGQCVWLGDRREVNKDRGLLAAYPSIGKGDITEPVYPPSGTAFGECTKSQGAGRRRGYSLLQMPSPVKSLSIFDFCLILAQAAN